MSLTFFNTLGQCIAPFQPKVSGQVSMYVCGPTVYDDPHLGHARCYLTWDVLYRYLQFSGYIVRYARNITDVDDKILKRATERNIPPEELTQHYTTVFRDAMAKLNILPPTDEPKATEHIQGMQDGITQLIEKGAAYPTADGTVYFRVTSKADYGKLSQKPLDDLQAGARVEVDPNKESPLDFALWKGIAADDPNGWHSPWGWGRPGWHMECSAMNMALFGPQIDIHCGGADLIFPHHENEIAQSECWTGETPFARYWLHNGFVNVSGEKMAKSLGNFATIQSILNRYSANTIRYFLLTNHYRMPVDFTDEALEAAENRMLKLEKWLKETLREKSSFEDLAEAFQHYIILKRDQVSKENIYLVSFAAHMDQDLNTALALGILNLAAKQLKKDPPELALVAVVTIWHHLGFDTTFLSQETTFIGLPEEALQSVFKQLTGIEDIWSEPENLLEVLKTTRQDAKKSKDFVRSDEIRDALKNIGIHLIDQKDGTTAHTVE